MEPFYFEYNGVKICPKQIVFSPPQYCPPKNQKSWHFWSGELFDVIVIVFQDIRRRLVSKMCPNKINFLPLVENSASQFLLVAAIFKKISIDSSGKIFVGDKSESICTVRPSFLRAIQKYIDRTWIGEAGRADNLFVVNLPQNGGNFTFKIVKESDCKLIILATPENATSQAG